MALNRDLAVIERHKLIDRCIVRGGADKQFVAAAIGKFLDKDDQKGCDKYISDLIAEREPKTLKQQDPERVKALMELIENQKQQLKEQSEQISQLTEKSNVVESSKGTAKPTEVNK